MTDDSEIDIVKYSHPGGMTVADRDQAKPLLKVLKRMLQPRHKQTKRFTKARTPRRTKHKQSQYY
jgi:hypothetical protein